MGQVLTLKFQGGLPRDTGRDSPCAASPGRSLQDKPGTHKGAGSAGQSAPGWGKAEPRPTSCPAAGPSRPHSRKDTGAGAAASRGERCRRMVSSRAAERPPSRPPSLSPSRSMAPSAMSQPGRSRARRMLRAPAPSEPRGGRRHGTAVGRA